MRPIHLVMEAFGPYGDRAEVDFDRLTEVGLFVVSGPTGAGKTSIFDAICFALYGSLAGDRASHTNVRSDYANPDAECQVWLEFEAGGDRWRVWRRPAQKRKRRRGDGFTDRPADASLERWMGDAWEPRAAKIREVNAACRELVGLSLEQFQRVVLLPQGKFQEVLNAGSNARADLLRTLFGSEIFDRTAEILKAKAKELANDVAKVSDRTDYLRASAHHSLSSAESMLGDAIASFDVDVGVGVSPEDVHETFIGEQQTLELSDPARGPKATVQQLRSWHAELADGPLSRLRIEAELRSHRMKVANAELNTATSQATALRQRSALNARVAELREEQTDQEQRAKDLAAAMMARPVAIAETRRATAEAGLQGSRGIVDSAATGLRAAIAPLNLDQGLAATCERALVDVDSEAAEPLAEFLASRRHLAAGFVELRREQVSAQDHLITLEAQRALQQKHQRDAGLLASRRAERRLELTDLIDTQSALAAQLPVRVAEHEREHEALRARVQLADLDDQIAAATAQAAALTDRRTAAADRLAALVKARDEAAALAALRPMRQADVAQAKRLVALHDEIAERRHALIESEAQEVGYRQEADELFACFVDGTAPRLAAELRPGQPCSVCGATEHPKPAREPNDQPATPGHRIAVSASQVAEAGSRAAKAQETVAGLRASVAGLIEQAGDGIGPDRAELHEAVKVASKQLDDAVAAGQAEAAAAADIEQLHAQRRTLDEQHETVTSGLGDLRGWRSERLGRIGSIELESVDVHRTRADAATRATVAARDAELEVSLRKAEAAELDEHQRGYEQSRRELVANAATAEAAIAQSRARIAAIDETINSAVGESGLDRFVARVDHALAETARWFNAVARHREQSRLVAAAADECVAALAASGFDDEAAALEAHIEPGHYAELEASNRAWSDEMQSVVTRLRLLQEQSLPDEAPDLELLVRQSSEAEEASNDMNVEVLAVSQLLEAASSALDEVDRVNSDTADAQRTYQVMAEVSGVVSGNNTRRITLENWVLAAYLRDVVDHANLHLDGMSSHRYQLVVQDEAANQKGQHGLDLEVEDSFSGKTRPTVSLSGGETFQASLSLALGLADVVCAGRVGIQVDALFVDEGFGSLDADSIDQAIDVLDSLRSRGSMVGVITHVEAMKAALPVAIEVLPRSDRQGSEIRQVA